VFLSKCDAIYFWYWQILTILPLLLGTVSLTIIMLYYLLNSTETINTFKGRVERIFFFASFKLPLFNEYEMVFIIA